MSKLKKTTATLLIAIFMISTLSVISVGAYTANNYTMSVLEAADRLVANQNSDGGFMWRLTSPPGSSTTNTLGITAMGILKAHELQDKTTYETSMAEAYKYAKNTAPGWTQGTTKWVENNPAGVNSWPDITFLVWLAEAATTDSTLLAAIQSEVSGTSVTDIADLAKARWDDRVDHMGDDDFPNLGTPGTAYAMAIYLRDARFGQGLPGLIPWDLEAAVKAALALESYFPTQGYITQANDITEVIYDCIYGTTTYFDHTDSSEICYNLGLAGAIEAFTETGLHTDKVSELKVLLIGEQNVAGYWDENSGGDTQSVQSTAYAVMALLAQGEEDAIASAKKGGDWLVSTQDTTGGWDPCYLGGSENLEVDSEAAWAIARARFMVRAIGRFTTNFDYLGSGTDHRCFINLHARQVADGWTGKGVFRDKDYDGGELKAVFTVESTTQEILPKQINFVGTADVYIGKEYQGNYVCEPTIFTTSTWEVFSFQIPYLSTSGYYAFVTGTDISVEMTLKVLD